MEEVARWGEIGDRCGCGAGGGEGRRALFAIGMTELLRIFTVTPRKAICDWTNSSQCWLVADSYFKLASQPATCVSLYCNPYFLFNAKFYYDVYSDANQSIIFKKELQK